MIPQKLSNTPKKMWLHRHPRKVFLQRRLQLFYEQVIFKVCSAEHKSNEDKLKDIFICVESRKRLETKKSKHSRENLIPVPVASPLREGK